MSSVLLRVFLLAISLVAASAWGEPLRVIREVDHDGANGAPFPPGAGVRLEIAPGAEAALRWHGGRQERIAPSQVSFAADADGAPVTVALDAQTGELLVLRGAGQAVVAETRRVRELAGVDARGVALDARNDRLFVIDGDRILVLDGLERGRPSVDAIELPGQLPDLAGLAYDPSTDHLFALAPEANELLELGLDGRLLAVPILPERARGARALAIAPSSDPTDAPERQSLFVAVESSGGGGTLELSAEPLVLAAAPTVGATLLQTVLTSNFSPPSPDPSGIELLSSNGPLLISDGEVDEMTIYRGVNLFEVSLAGNLVGTSDTTFYSNEPTGVARNPSNGHLFTSDDDGKRTIYEVTPGSDNRITSGDPVRAIIVGGFTTDMDPEGVAYGNGSLWIADGVGAEVWRIQPGSNGVFDGGGDDVITHFDTAAAGLTDPEGIAFDTDGGNLYVVGEPTNRIGHFSSSGTLLRWLDTSAGNPSAPAGLAYGPGPAGDPTRRLYVVARGVDNNSDPNENDGKLFTFAVSPLSSGNQAPVVFAGPDLAADISSPVALDGDVFDDGQPNPPGTVTTTWSQLSGPGTIGFGNKNAIDTTATFSSVGTYVARLTASDSELSTSDDVTITVSASSGQTTVERRVAASSDDAEQKPSGSVSLTSSDLELVTDGTTVQTVGIRFASLPIPAGAPIQEAWIQFQTNEVSTDAASLTIQGEASDNAVTFTSGSNNVGARPRTPASVAWAPPAWNVAGEATLAQRTPSLATVVQQIVNRAGWASGNAMAFLVTGSGRRTAEAYDGKPAAAPLLHVVYGSGGSTPTNAAPSVSAGADQSVPFGQAASLDGTASDDGLPNPPGALTTTWSKVSGPGTVAFANASAVDTTATFSAAGSYVLRLTASDSALQASDDVTVSVTSSGNNAPTVSAGPDQSVLLGDVASLDGTVGDDGLPNPPGALTTSWSTVSGPGTVTFGNANAVDTTATFSAAGSYVLRLTASDSALQTSDDVTVSVVAAPTNNAPTVSAGPDRSVLLGDAASLDGTVGDDGLPNPPGALTTTWSQVSGPGTVAFANASAVDTTATFSVWGSYVLRLTASDSELAASDDVTVTVVDPNGSGVVEQRIVAGADDAEQRTDRGQTSLTGDDLELVVDGKHAQVVGLRFPNLVIPPGANIRTAWIQFRTDETKNTSGSLTLRAEANANPGAFVASSFNISNRPLGSSSASWSPPTWSLVGEAGAGQRTPELKTLVQEAVNRSGWKLGNAMVFVISGNGTRIAESFEGLASGAPLLHVEYGP